MGGTSRMGKRRADDRGATSIPRTIRPRNPSIAVVCKSFTLCEGTTHAPAPDRRTRMNSKVDGKPIRFESHEAGLAWIVHVE